MDQQTLPCENENSNNITEVCENLNSDQDTFRTCSTFDFTRNTGNTDLIIVVEGTHLHVSKTALILASPVFEKMFQQDFKEKSLTELELPGKKLSDVLEFLRCIYPTTLTQVNGDNVMQILPLVEEYQVFQLKPSCEKILLDMIDDNTSSLRLYEFLKKACLYGLHTVRAKCVEMAAGKSKKELNEAKSKIQPPADALNEVLEKINERLELKIEDLKSEKQKQDKQLTEKISKLDFQLKEVTGECQILKSYWSQHTRKSNMKTFDLSYNWKGSSVVLQMVVGNPSCESSVKCWDVTLKVRASVVVRSGEWCSYSRKYASVEWLNVNVSHSTYLYQSGIWSNVIFNYVVINRFGKDDSLVLWHDDTFDDYRKQIEKDLVKVTEIKNNDFASDGKICILVNIFMTEPVPLKK